MPQQRPIGIDLGTTYTAAAFIDAGQTEMIRNSEGDILTPSVVLFDEDCVIVGKEAKKAGVLQAGRVADCAKRDMGEQSYSRPIGGEYFPPEVVQACILSKLKSDIQRRVGPDFSVVITVPAFFDEPRRRATAIAGRIAGLDVLDIVNEPTAAALAFGEQSGLIGAAGSEQAELRVVVYDLGGGTFDVTLLDVSPASFRTLATDGDRQLGGRDWDEGLLQLVAEQFVKCFHEPPPDDPNRRQRLMLEVEHAKHTLSVRQRAVVHVDHGGSHQEFTVTRLEFEAATSHLLERTATTTRQLVESQNIPWNEISDILLVGGATRMPMVSAMLESISDNVPQRVINPDEAVARGAAIYAKYLLDSGSEQAAPSYTIKNVNAHALGVRGIEVDTREDVNATLIPKNTTLPAKASRTFVTRKENQKSVVIEVLEGDSSRPDDCAKLGRTTIWGLPRGLPRGHPIEVSFEYLENGCLSVDGRLRDVDQATDLLIERSIEHAASWIDRWRKTVCDNDDFQSFRSTNAVREGSPEVMAARAPAENAVKHTDEVTEKRLPDPAGTISEGHAAGDLHRLSREERSEQEFTSGASPTDIAGQTLSRRRRLFIRQCLAVAHVIGGGLMGLLLGQILLWQVFDADPFGLAPRLPDALEFLGPQDLPDR